MLDVAVATSFFAEEFPSDFQAMSQVLGRAVDALVDQGWVMAGDATRARLCLEEAMVNAIRHGNQCDCTRMVRLRMLEDGDLCVIRVYDEGSGFRPEEVQLPSADRLGGRGICLIRHYAEYIRYNEEEGCFELAFRRSRLGQGETDTCQRKRNA